MTNKFERVSNNERRFNNYPDEEFFSYLNDELKISASIGGNGISINSLYAKEIIKNENENRLYQLAEYVLNHKLWLNFGGYEVREHLPIGLYRTIDIYKN